MALLLAFLALAAPFKVTLTAPTHAPAVNKRWPYEVRVVDSSGKPMPAKITAQVVDPIGAVHAVEFGLSHKTVTNWPIRGIFKDFVIWPPDSQGFQLTFRVIVTAAGGKQTLTYPVKAK